MSTVWFTSDLHIGHELVAWDLAPVNIDEIAALIHEEG